MSYVYIINVIILSLNIALAAISSDIHDIFGWLCAFTWFLIYVHERER